MPFFVIWLDTLSILAGQNSVQIRHPLHRSSTMVILGVSRVEAIVLTPPSTCKLSLITLPYRELMVCPAIVITNLNESP